jgi:hypothetical protein
MDPSSLDQEDLSKIIGTPQHPMTDVMREQQPVDLDELVDGEHVGADVDAVHEQLIARLAGRAREGGLALTGEGGLLVR